MYRGIAIRIMGLKLNRYTGRPNKSDYLPWMTGKLKVKYNHTVYDVKGFIELNDSEKLILQDPNQPDYELIVELFRVKPLLRRMSSMTRGEEEYYKALLDSVEDQPCGLADWLNSNMFDYDDLIGHGRAEEL